MDSYREKLLSLNIPEDVLDDNVRIASIKLYEALDRKSGSTVPINARRVEEYVMKMLHKMVDWAGYPRQIGDRKYTSTAFVERTLERIPEAAINHWEKVLFEVADMPE